MVRRAVRSLPARHGSSPRAINGLTANCNTSGEGLSGRGNGLFRRHRDRSRGCGRGRRAGAGPGSRRSTRLTPDAPLVVLVHGYKFHPDRPGTDPHRSLFACRPSNDDWRIRSWPEGLGIADDAGETGLAIGFAWPASAPHVATLIRQRRTGFAEAYDRAGAFGAHLASWSRWCGNWRRAGRSTCWPIRSAPGWPSPRCRIWRAARADHPARRGGARRPGARASWRRCGRGAEIYNVTARSNDLYDLAFETFVPRRAGVSGPSARGLGRDRRPGSTCSSTARR